MRSVLTELVHLLFSVPAYLCLLLAALTYIAIKRQRSGNINRSRWVWFGALLLAYAASIPATSSTLVTWIEQQHPQITAAHVIAANQTDSPPTILVLSGGWFRTTKTGSYEVILTSQDWQRIHSSIELWKAVGGELIFSGAPVPDGSDSVAQRMAAAAVSMGVPASAVRTETRSVNTLENLQFSAALFALRKPVVLVTSALHMPRSVSAAKKIGLPVLPYPCDFRGDQQLSWRHWLPSNDAATALEQVLHEFVGMLSYRLKE